MKLMKLWQHNLKRDDEYYTPDYAVRPVLEFLPPHSRIFCPFDTAESEYVKILSAAGHRVIFSHKDTGDDFFEYASGNNQLFEKALPDFDYLISNPPFHNKRQIVERVVAMKRPFMLLLPMTWLNDTAPFALFEKIGLELMIFDRRIHFKGKGTQPNFGCGYYCHGVLPDKIVFRKL